MTSLSMFISNMFHNVLEKSDLLPPTSMLLEASVATGGDNATARHRTASVDCFLGKADDV